MEEAFQFDRERFKDVLHYAVHYACKRYDPDSLGNTKLHKVLYFTDMLHYLEHGCPLTGADYLRQKFGPIARHLSWATESLRSEGRISMSDRSYHGYTKKDYQALVEPSTMRLSRSQTNLIEEIVDFVCAKTAVEISDFSHDHVWASVPMGDRIPYYAAYAMFPAEVSERDIEEATAEAIQLVTEMNAADDHAGSLL